ncbi:hypothetical protein BOX15_Mlig005992g2, partial [Macrostomum lignano]
LHFAGSSFSKAWHNRDLPPKAPLVVPVTNSSQLRTVRFSTGDFEPSASCGRIELTIAVAKKGFCGRHMLLHRGRCLFISGSELRLSDLSGTGVELAAISGTEQLHELMRDNDDRTNAHPFIRPLNLTRPVRVAVFRCNKIIQWTQVAQTVSSSLCVIGNFSTTGAAQESFTRRNQSISSQVDCASISAEPDDSEKLKLSFIDCDQPQHLLLSFLIEPINQDLQHNSNCLESTITSCKDLSMHVIFKESTDKETDSSDKTDLIALFVSVTVSLLVLAVILVVAVKFFVFKRQGRRRKSRRSKPFDSLSGIPLRS